VAYPDVFVAARELRSFMHRATRLLAREHGIRQWLDIGTGIPTEPNLHQVAQSIAPDARVVYADNDPLVLKHAAALMRSAPEGRTAYIHADVTRPDAILSAPELSEVLDLSKPVALSLNALLHFVPDDWGPYDLVGRLMAALPSGSALALSHVTGDFAPEAWDKIHDIYTRGGTALQVRNREETTRFFDGLDLVDPGVVVGHRWHPEYADPAAPPREDVTEAEVSSWAGVAIKP
jgi:hypothetical protein